jgi:hypothetical protein
MTIRHPYRVRRMIAAIVTVAGLVGVIITHPSSYTPQPASNANAEASADVILATTILSKLEIKGRAPKTGYDRKEFYAGWPNIDGCSLRQHILKRELGSTAVLADDKCTVLGGEFDEPYTGKHLVFSQKSDLSSGLQIDHVVALSDAWQKGAQYLDEDIRYQIATDPLNLLAVDSKTNQGKSDGDAATWLPPNKAFRCQYIARQISVKYKYQLWVTQAEHDAMAKVLQTCPNEPTIGVELKEND